MPLALACPLRLLPLNCFRRLSLFRVNPVSLHGHQSCKVFPSCILLVLRHFDEQELVRPLGHGLARILQHLGHELDPRLWGEELFLAQASKCTDRITGALHLVLLLDQHVLKVAVVLALHATVTVHVLLHHPCGFEVVGRELLILLVTESVVRAGILNDDLGRGEPLCGLGHPLEVPSQRGLRAVHSCRLVLQQRRAQRSVSSSAHVAMD
mmetsp:Transcript_15371/g.31223  ORF Transcript_15371/g.31223 Transcript_15371/m.31223 type:complete len:210 (-) Transcript_15371:942-1571(-)